MCHRASNHVPTRSSFPPGVHVGALTALRSEATSHTSTWVGQPKTSQKQFHLLNSDMMTTALNKKGRSVSSRTPVTGIPTFNFPKSIRHSNVNINLDIFVVSESSENNCIKLYQTTTHPFSAFSLSNILI